MKLKLSELFYSLQGEGRYVGVPSIFMRTFGCNFTCGGFGMPRGEISQERFAVDATKFSRYKDLPLVTTGCDSYASWDPRFKQLSNVYSIDDIAYMMAALLPMNKFCSDYVHEVHLVITGGEPLLGWQRVYPDLLKRLRSDLWLKNVTFETNGTQHLTDEFIEYLIKSDNEGLVYTFSISPKLSASGEKWSDAIRPDVVREYQDVFLRSTHHQFDDLYFKFVVDSPDDIAEVEQAVNEYRDVGVLAPVYLMPVGGTGDLYYKNNQIVAKMAMDRGWRYSPRIQVDLWKNAWGT